MRSPNLATETNSPGYFVLSIIRTMLFASLAFTAQYSIAQDKPRILAKTQSACDTYEQFWSDVVDQIPDAAIIAPCEPDYNCHGFVRSYFESGCTVNPFTYYQSYTCPDGVHSDFRSDKYIETSSLTDADVVYYDTGQPGGHSAVKVDHNTYVSKWGNDGPLVRHTLYGVWEGYGNSTKSYYIYIAGEISGNNQSLGTTSRTFSVPYNPSLAYYWWAETGLTLDSSPYNSSVQVRKTSEASGGTKQLNVRITSDKDSETFSLPISLTASSIILGTWADSQSSNNYLNTVNMVAPGYVTADVTFSGASSFTWSKTSGSAYYYTQNSGSRLVISNLFSGQSISFELKAKSGSSTLATRMITFYAM